MAITREDGSLAEQRAFDAWGNIREVRHFDALGETFTTDTTLGITDRGYTGHEHLQSVDLIHMNGRLYDALLRRFIMPDNFVQDSSNTQNYNRYSYVLNNPLLYTDPSGEKWNVSFKRIGLFLKGAVKVAAAAFLTGVATAFLGPLGGMAVGYLLRSWTASGNHDMGQALNNPLLATILTIAITAVSGRMGFNFGKELQMAGSLAKGAQTVMNAKTTIVEKIKNSWETTKTGYQNKIAEARGKLSNLIGSGSNAEVPTSGSGGALGNNHGSTPDITIGEFSAEFPDVDFNDVYFNDATLRIDDIIITKLSKIEKYIRLLDTVSDGLVIGGFFFKVFGMMTGNPIALILSEAMFATAVGLEVASNSATFAGMLHPDMTNAKRLKNIFKSVVPFANNALLKKHGGGLYKDIIEELLNKSAKKVIDLLPGHN